MSFDIQRHPEDFEEFEIYNSMKKYMEEIVAANKAFTSGIKQLIGYKRISTLAEYRAAVCESYEEADETMKDLLAIEGINSSSDFIIYLNGVVEGMNINE